MGDCREMMGREDEAEKGGEGRGNNEIYGKCMGGRYVFKHVFMRQVPGAGRGLRGGDHASSRDH